MSDCEYIFRRSVINETIATSSDYEHGFRDGREAAARLCERERCRNWDAKECARQIRDDRQIPPRKS